MLMSQGKPALISLATQFTAMSKGLASHYVDQAGLASHYVDQAGLQLMERPICLCLRVLGPKTCAPLARSYIYIYI